MNKCKIKVGIVALSVNSEILEKMFMKTIHHMTDTMKDLNVVVFTQGYDYEGSVPEGSGLRVKVIRDDSRYKKGYSISEIREYFTNRVINEADFRYDYILFTDDDFKFRENSGRYLLKSIDFMENHPEAGLVNFKMTSKPVESSEFSKINPTFVYMRGGILVRASAYAGWGGDQKCIYYEEAVLATHIYAMGYDVYCTDTDIVHRTVASGLGKTIERENKDNFQTINGGRQVLFREGHVIPQKDSEGNYDFKKPCKLSSFCETRHKIGLNSNE